MAVQAIKGVEIGLGFEAARRRGSQVHDPIHFDPAQVDSPSLGYVRPTNNAGGLEAGMTNGQPLVVRAAKKPISTLRKPLDSINLATKEPADANYERSDVCAVPAASVIIESVVAFEVAVHWRTSSAATVWRNAARFSVVYGVATIEELRRIVVCELEFRTQTTSNNHGY